MSLKQWLSRGAVLLAVLLPAACVPILDDSCGPTFRETVIRGDIRGATGITLGVAEVRLVEVRGDPQPRRLQSIVMGPGYGSAGAPLKGHVTRARLVAANGDVLFELSVAPGLGDETLRTLDEPIPDPAAFDALKRRFKAGEVSLVLETDLAGSERLRVPLPLLRAGDWDRAHCS
ncbi:MAG TPA: hypothetical protein VHG28_11230 [Longimicrobiaceae bacterium]|nr:hypothetical protein [Longimicrobiaceae bacterium]